MLRKGDQGTDQSDPGRTEQTELNNEISRDDLLSQSEAAKKIFDDIQSLKENLNALKTSEVFPSASETAKAAEPTKTSRASELAEAVEAAKAAEPTETSRAAELAEAVEAAKAADAAEAAETAAPEESAKLSVEKETAESEKPAEEDERAEFERKYREQMETQMQAVQEKSRDKNRQKAERAAQKEAERKRKEAFRQEKARRNREKKEERRAKARQLKEERALRAEVKKKKRLAKKSAELGGGVVNLHDTTVNTEIQPVPEYSLKELLGVVTIGEKKAASSEEELKALLEERELKKEEARAMASHLNKVRANRYHNSPIGQRIDAIKGVCDRHKTLLLIALSLVLMICVGMAGVFNYCTAYEYSYNGHILGYVKNKDEVLRITDMVQQALTEDKNMQVIINARDDISFRRVSTLDKAIVPDSSEEVLRRLTYMGDLNVKAWGIYVNGNKVGSVRSKEDAARVLRLIEERYASDKKGSVIEKAEILETVEFKKSNTSLRQVYSPKRMTEILCTSGEKESLHTVVAGETLDDIAHLYGTTEEKLLAENENVDPHQLEVGSQLMIRQNAPILTVRMTEKRTYEKVIEFKTEEKKTEEMYQGDEEIQQEGEDGAEEITERTVSINGERESRKVLKMVTKKEPVTKIILVGTAERPPTVGDGKYIWPLAGGYTLTSRFGYRWGRLHAGIDLGTPVGNDVLAADGGIVVRAGYFGGYGNCVDIDHQNGQMTRYGHLSSILVSPGQEVYEGQHIAESGNTGRSTGAHLHFEIHTNGTPHDPLIDLP